MVRALFAVARCFQPAVIFIDEIDSLLTKRTDTENESSRRMKTEFLVQIDGAATSKSDKILLLGATNRPQELDEAARRRLTKKLYIPLPDFPARVALIRKLMSNQANTLTDGEIELVANQTHGYSGSDLHQLCVEAALGPVRSLGSSIRDVAADKVRPVSCDDFTTAVIQVKASVEESEIQSYIEFNNRFGTKGM
jgi:fidgetin-like protein 1